MVYFCGGKKLRLCEVLYDLSSKKEINCSIILLVFVAIYMALCIEKGGVKMEAEVKTIADILDSNRRQFVIPVYQRNYDWSKQQCKQLLDDIIEVGTNETMDAHFIGSIVHIHDGGYTGARIYTGTKIKELTVIDGQQRLTTLTLIYLVIYRIAKELDDTDLESEIEETYLINKFAAEEGKLKLKPTENNDKALKYLLRGDTNVDFPDFSKLVINFDYFKGRITKENYQDVLAGLAKLMVVEISLDQEKDDSQRIFESLNSTGLELSQADLIRNYILMKLDRQNQKKIYENYWEIIESLAKNESSNISKVSDYIRDYLTLENKSIPNKRKVYLEFKAKYPTSPSVDELKNNLEGIKRLASHYNKLINPQNESNKEIRLQLEYINRLEINVAFPFLMKVYDDYTSGIIDKSTFLNVLELVQSFVWRRFIVGLPTNALNKIFERLYDKDKINTDNYLLSIQKLLLQTSRSQGFPKDEAVIEALKIKDVYNINSRNRDYFFDRIESFENREKIVIVGNSDITVEHIFPKNPDPKWKTKLDNEEYDLIKNKYLHSIGNLTLSGNNGKLGNKYFTDKRDLDEAGYRDSRLWVNRYLSTLDRWGIKEIESRIALISKRFLKIWEYPQIEIETNNDNGEINIFDADTPKGKSLEYAIFLDQQLEVKKISDLYEEVFKLLFELQPELFFNSDLSKRIKLTNNPSEIKRIRQAVQVGDTYFIEGHMDSVSKFDKIKYALIIFNLEEELLIKYA